ncbi:hypothetical protein HY411_01075 [Candidatus Gottesmanbacteria bacterium]|nr:hypothetical protein [Candidatus Gottesmanbacteria bacterium]
MANGQQLESGSPEREAFHQLFEELNAQVDESGNRSLAKVLEKHPFPIYEATVRRFRMINERLTKDLQQSPGTGVEEFAVKVGGAAAEVLVAGFDLVWDMTTAPVHLTLYPGIRHPLYKATLAKLASNDGEEKINYTANMAVTTRPEGESPFITDSLVPPIEMMPPSALEEVPPVPPGPIDRPKPELEESSSDTEQKSEEVKSALPPTLSPEHSGHSPQREAFHQLMRDIFEVTEPALREDVRDRITSTGKLTLTAAEAWHETTKTPWNLPRHLRNFDTALRGRDLGSLKMRFARDAVNSLIALGAVSVDILDAPAEAGDVTPLTGMAAAGWEFLTDSAINYGTNFVVQTATDDRRAHYASPLSRTISTVVNLFPGIRQFVNAPMLESFFRRGYNAPIAGIPVELLYRHANDMLMLAERDPRLRWVEEFMVHIIGGFSRGRAAQRQRAARPATG